MTGLAMQSQMIGVAGNSPTTLPLVASLALAVFRNARNVNDNNPSSHSRPSRSRNEHGRPLSSPRNENARKAPRRVLSSGGNKSGTNNMDTPAIRLYHRWLRLPQIFRFCVAGNLGNLGFFYLEKLIFRLLTDLIVMTPMLSSIILDGIEKFQDSISFFSAYAIQIVTTHLLYAFLVYGMDTIDTYEKYWKTLSGQFKVYGVGLFGATFLNSFLISSGGLDKTVAFWATISFFAVFNYFLISWVVKKAVESSSADSIGNGGNYPTKPSRRGKII